MSALQQAMAQGKHDTVKWLIRHKARMLGVGCDAPLYLAFASDDDRMIRLLLKATTQYLAGELRFNAIASHSQQALRAMLRHVFPAHPPLEAGGHSPLIQALAFGMPEAVELLLQHGADADYVSRHISGEIESALSSAVKTGTSSEVITLLLAAMKPTVVMNPDLAQQLFKRANDEKDYRVLNELARKSLVDADGKRYDPAQI